jgi:hypothetical protein
MLKICRSLAAVNLLIVAAFAIASAQTPSTSQETCPDANEVIKRGAPLGNAPAIVLADALSAPKLFSEKEVRIQGVVERSCTNKGCWMEIASKPGDPGVRVTFKDYGFFVPLNSKGMNATAEGQFSVVELSKEKADHLETEGARLKRNADGSASEVTFIASGVELRK